MATESVYPIDDTIASARGAAASLAQIATALAEAAAEPTPTPSTLRHVAHTIQAHAQRASLGAMSLAAQAGRLEAFAHAQTLEAEAAAQRHAAARAEVEQEAGKDARLYLDDTAPGREPLEQWAAHAFEGQWQDFWEHGLGGIEREHALAWYLAAFTRAAKAGEPS